MNQIIKDQLSKVKAVDINFNDSSTEIYIPKTLDLNKAVLKCGQCFLISINEETINNDTLASNWNHGKRPKYKTYTAEIVDIMAKMVRVDGVAKNDLGEDLLTERFYGWLPVSGFTVIKKL